MEHLLMSLLALLPLCLLGTVLYGVNQTKARTPSGANILDPGLLGGNVKVMVDTYVIAAESDGDTIEMGKQLPKGATVLEIILSCNASVAATVTADVGDYEDIDRYMAGVDLSSAAINRIDEPDTGAGYQNDETYTGTTVGSGTDRQIVVRLNTMTTPVAGTIITCIILYTHE